MRSYLAVGAICARGTERDKSKGKVRVELPRRGGAPKCDNDLLCLVVTENRGVSARVGLVVDALDNGRAKWWCPAVLLIGSGRKCRIPHDFVKQVRRHFCVLLLLALPLCIVFYDTHLRSSPEA